MNVITGLPRSGSTLLCNILNQNPRFWASSTSTLAVLCANLISTWSTSAEVKGDLQQDRDETEQRLMRSLKVFCEAWHKDRKEKIIFDKSRPWMHHLLPLRQVFPESKVIVCVRDLRDVFASVEKQHLKNPILDDARNPQAKTLHGRADTMFSPDGFIGSPLNGLSDVIRRRQSVYWFKYETFVERPKATMKELYEYLEEKEFDHDFENIENTATDPDAFYLNKFPHEGNGRVEVQSPNGWKEFLSNDIAAAIMTKFPEYNQFFHYA